MGKGLTTRISSFLSGALVKNTLKLTGGSVVNYIIPFITTPILTRLYSPSSYGDWGVFSSIISILSVFVCAGYENAIIEEQNKDRRNAIVRLCLYIAVIINIVLLAILGILTALNVDLFNIQNILLLLPIYLLITGFVTVLQSLANANGRYNNLAVAQIIAGVTLGGFRIIFGVINIDNGLVYGALVSSLCVVVYLLVTERSTSSHIFRFDIRSIKRIIADYKNYPLFDAPSSFLIFLSNNIPVLLLVNFFDKALLGGYTMVLQLLLLPMSFIGSNMGRVFFQQASSNRDTLSEVSKQVYKISFFLGLAILVFFLIGGDYLLYLFLGPNWEVAGEYALYLSLWAFFTISFASIKPVYRVKSQQSVQMKLMILAFIIQTGYLLASVYIFKSMGLIIMTYSIVCSIFKIIEGRVLLGFCDSRQLLFEHKSLLITIVVVSIWLVRSLIRLGLL